MKPKAAPAHFPYTAADGHRTMAEVMRREAHCREMLRVRRAKAFGYQEPAE